MVCQLALSPPSAFADFSPKHRCPCQQQKGSWAEKQFWIDGIPFTSEYQPHRPYYLSYHGGLQRHMQAEQSLDEADKGQGTVAEQGIKRGFAFLFIYFFFFARVFPSVSVFPPLPAWIANEQVGLSSIKCLESLNSEGRQCSFMCSRLEGWHPKGQIHCLETRHEPLAADILHERQLMAR